VVKIPIVSRKPIPEDQVAAFFRCVDDSRNHPILIHCSAGRHRTGYLCALYRIERQGWTVQRAIEEMLSFGFGIEKHAAILDQLERYEPGRLTNQPEQVADIEQPAVEAPP
jgi:protein tyrosine/serine phosphatase